MLISTLIVAARDRARLQEMVAVASRFGLGVLLGELGLAERPGTDTSAGDRTSMPRRVRLALEELGPTFVKLGQVLATRGDLLSPEWIGELEQLHSKAQTLPFADLRRGVEEALGAPPEEAFATFDTAPIAAASMAQVHRATLHDGSEVVLKVQRPGIRPRMEADVRLLSQVAAVAERTSAPARRFQPVQLVRQLAEGLLDELDFTQEGRNADRLRADFAGDRRVVVPTIYWSFTSPMLLVMDYIVGVPPRDGEVLRANGLDPAVIADTGADMVIDMLLMNGRFHADPHPGNLLCLPGNRIALLDLGMIGHVSPRRREQFLAFVEAIIGGDAALLTDVLAIWSAGGSVTDDAVMRASEHIVTTHSGKPLVIGPLVTEFMALMRDEGLVLPPDLLLMFKALLTIDGVLDAIRPNFDLSGAMRRAMLRVARQRLSPQHWGPIIRAVALELARMGDDAPRLVRNVVRRLGAEPVSHVPVTVPGTPAGARLIAGAIVLGSVVIAGATLLR